MAGRWPQWQLPAIFVCRGGARGLLPGQLTGPASRDLLAQTSSPHLPSPTYQPSIQHLQCSWSVLKLSRRGMGPDSCPSQPPVAVLGL